MERENVYEVQMAALSPLLEEVVASGGTAEITVTGNSMYPMLKHRKSRVRLVSADVLRIGDIPLYRRENGNYILHRIIETEGESYICCGDNQWHGERGIKQGQVIAVVREFRRGIFWISCGNPVYRCYWRLWLRIRPLRHLLFGGFRRIKKFLISIAKKEKKW